MVFRSKIRFLFSFPNCWGYFWIHNYTPNNVTFRAKKNPNVLLVSSGRVCTPCTPSWLTWSSTIEYWVSNAIKLRTTDS